MRHDDHACGQHFNGTACMRAKQKSMPSRSAAAAAAAQKCLLYGFAVDTLS
jgi:hypothetical protein